MLSVQHAAEYCDVSKWTIQRLIANGELRAMRVGKRIRIAQSDLDHYIQRAS